MRTGRVFATLSLEVEQASCTPDSQHTPFISDLPSRYFVSSFKKPVSLINSSMSRSIFYSNQIVYVYRPAVSK